MMREMGFELMLGGGWSNNVIRAAKTQNLKRKLHWRIKINPIQMWLHRTLPPMSFCISYLQRKHNPQIIFLKS